MKKQSKTFQKEFMQGYAAGKAAQPAAPVDLEREAWGNYPRMAVVGFLDGKFEAEALSKGRAIPPLGLWAGFLIWGHK